MTDESQDGLVTFSDSADSIVAQAVERVTIRGLGASRGIVTGQVVHINDRNDARKVKRGNIIVTTMTTPEHIDAMYRAAGVITSTGGITCHAAVIMRELDKPSVVGCGRDVLGIKDGTWVTVNGDKGEVILLPS